MKASERRYRDDVATEYPYCVCGAPVKQQHHIIHLNGQRITKDEMLVVGLCDVCHRLLHSLGGDRQFEEKTGHSTVHLAVLRRHDWEVRNG